MDLGSLLAALLAFFVPTDLSQALITSEAVLFLPILIQGYRRGWWFRIGRRMDRWLSLTAITCPRCGTEIK